VAFVLVLLLTPSGCFHDLRVKLPVGLDRPPAPDGLVTPSQASMPGADENMIALGHGPTTIRPFECGPAGFTVNRCGVAPAIGSIPSAPPYSGWGNLTPYLSQSPSSRWGAAMAYDANISDEYVVLFGGEGPTGALGDTWVFQSGTWTNMTPSAPNSTNTPSPRYGAVMVYDSSDGYVVLVGGASSPFTGSNAPLLNDSWEFLHGIWVRLCVSCTAGVDEPGPRFMSSASDDPSAGGAVLFGGLTTASGSYSVLSDTWKFAAGVWGLLSPSTSPPARFGAGLSLLPTGPPILFGGCARALPVGGPTCVAPLNDSWTFAANAWADFTGAPGAAGFRSSFGFAASPTQGLVLAFGGLSPSGLLNDTLIVDQGGWTDLTDTLLSSPSPRDNVALTYDSRSGTNYFVLFGGWNGTFLQETWVYPSPFDPLRVGPPVANLTVTDAGYPIRLNLSIAGGAGPYTRTWLGLPTGCATANTSSLVCRPSSPPVPSVSVTYIVSVRVRDRVGSIVWSPSTTIQVNAGPTAVNIGPLPGSLNEGSVPWNTTFVATWSGGTPPFVLNWNFGDGSSNQSGNPATHEYTVAGDFTVSVFVTDSLGETALPAFDAVVSRPPLAVNLTVSSSATGLGSPVTFHAQVTGGFPPYTYLWTGLPSSCAATNAAMFTCSAQAAGTYVVVVRVTDSLEGSRSSSSTLVVHSTAAPYNNPWPILIAVIAAGVAILAVLAVLRWRKRRDSSSPEPPSPPVVAPYLPS
jgi:PKD domain-containing protein/galactose oxidase-like protein